MMNAHPIRDAFALSAAVTGLILLVSLCGDPAHARSYAAPIQADGGEIPVGGTFGTVGGAGTRADPFSVADFFASPGDNELILLDGTYRGAGSMLNFDHGGSAANPLFIHADHDGAVLIDAVNPGENPIKIKASWTIVEGVNARSIASTALGIGSNDPEERINNVTVRRVVAWRDPIPCVADPCVVEDNVAAYEAISSENSHVASTRSVDTVLFEDVAAWGRGRKTLEIFRSTDVTVRRVWLRSEGNFPWPDSSNLKAITCQYRSHDVTCENVIATVGGSPNTLYQPADFDDRPNLFSTDGAPKSDPLTGVLEDTWAKRDPKSVGLKILGSIAYNLPGSKLISSHGIRIGAAGNYPSKGLKNAQIDSSVVWLRSDSSGKRLSLHECDDPINPGELDGCSWDVGEDRIEAPTTFENVTLRGGLNDSISAQWGAAANSDDDPAAELEIDIYTPGGPGASICFRTENGVLTNKKLWPWPMQERIKAATALSIWETADVMAELGSLFASVPSACLDRATTSGVG